VAVITGYPLAGGANVAGQLSNYCKILVTYVRAISLGEITFLSGRCQIMATPSTFIRHDF